jgi:hypothetical protein
MGQFDEAARYMLLAARSEGAPPWLSSLGIRLLSQSGALWSALEIALQLYSENSTAEGQQRLKNRIRSLRFEIQKEQWSEALAAFIEKHRTPPENLDAVRPYLKNSRDLASVEAPWKDAPELTPLLSEVFPFGLNNRGEIVPLLSAAEVKQLRAGIYTPETL